MERQIQFGRVYKHFKGNKYIPIMLAENSETGEIMILYKALYGEYKIYVRPYDMFVSPVDKDKYPEAKQYYRFELLEEDK